MKNKKIIIGLLIVIIIEIIAIFIVAIRAINIKTQPIDPEIKEKAKEKIKEIEDKEKQEEKQENLTQEYKEYEKLTEEEKKDLEVVPRKEKIEEKELDKIIETQKKETQEEIPSYFNLKDKINIKVENQGSYSLCWAFASLKTLETYMQLNNEKEYNFSEIKVDYITSELLFGNRKLHDGGSFDIFEEYLMRTGPKIEKEKEYHEYESEDYEKFIEEENITRVTETINFPAIYKQTSEKKLTDEEYKQEKEKFRKAVKTHIMTKGALYATISTPKETNHFCTGICSPSHAITIVGWDDNYKKENFKIENNEQPKNDGAYIALNSWGEEWGENGYFYIAYEDEAVEREMSGITSTSLEQSTDLAKITSEKIKKELDKNYLYTYIDNHITNLTLKKITNLDLKEKELETQDLESLNILTNLLYIDISKNKIEDISPLNLKKLTSLEASDNKIKDVSNLKLENLKYLYLNNNEDIKGLENLKNVESISLENDNIEEIDLSNLKKLKTLYLSNNPIEVIILPEEMVILELKNANITNLNKINNLKKIFYINLQDNNLTSLDGIDNIEKIESINLENNKLTSLNKLEKFKELKSINLKNNKIKNTDGLKGKTFEHIDLSNNEIENIEIINGINVDSITLENNNITDLLKLKNDSIRFINLSRNPNITDYSPLKNIEQIILEENNITNAEILEGLTNVEFLLLNKNNIGNITPLNNLLKLKNLYLDENKNMTGTLENNVVNLSLKDCNLNEFDITKLKNLSSIDISDNNIKILDIIKDKKEKIFITGDNLLLTQTDLEYLINEKDILNEKEIYIGLYKPIINIDVETPYNLTNLEWLKLNNNYEIKNGTLENNIIDIIEKEQPIVINLKDNLNFSIYNPILTFNVN